MIILKNAIIDKAYISTLTYIQPSAAEEGRLRVRWQSGLQGDYGATPEEWETIRKQLGGVLPPANEPQNKAEQPLPSDWDLRALWSGAPLTPYYSAACKRIEELEKEIAAAKHILRKVTNRDEEHLTLEDLVRLASDDTYRCNERIKVLEKNLEDERCALVRVLAAVRCQ